MAAAASLWVKLGLSDEPFVKSLKQAETKLNQFGNRLGSIGDRMIRGFSFPVGIAVGTMIKFGAELEQTKIAFEVMTGSADKAAKMVSDFQQMAARTPFETRDLLQNAQVLMQYGVAADKTKGTLQMLGDVSTGNAEKLGLITYAFAQINAQGRLMGQDLRQLVNAGFNPLKEISDKTGKSMMQLKKDMEDGKISFEMVEAAFKSATSEGGRFYGMMDKQSQTTAGKFSTFKDNVIIALTNIGTALLPFANKVMESLSPITKVLENVANWFSRLPLPIQNTIGSLILMSIAIGPLMKGLQFMIGGWSALIGIMRLLPTLKIGSVIGTISTYIGGAIAGTWSWSAAMGALSATFAPFLVGGAIIVGLGVIVAMFVEAGRQAKVMAMDMKTAGDMAMIQESMKLNQERLIALQKQRIADKEVLSQPQTPSNVEAQKMAKLRTTGQEAERRRLLELEYGTQIQAGQQRLKQLSGEFSTAAGSFDEEWKKLLETMNGSANPAEGNTNTISEIQERLAESFREIEAKVKLNIPGYDATKERLQALQSALDSAVGATDANTDDGKMAIQLMVNAYKMLYGTIEESGISIQSWTDAIESATDAAKAAKQKTKVDWFGNQEENQTQYQQNRKDTVTAWTEAHEPKLYKFGEYLDQTAELMKNFQGPLKEFGQSISGLISQIQAVDFKSLTSAGFKANSQGPLGEIGGVMGAIGAMSGIIGLAMTVVSQLMGDSAKAQQKAAEEWRQFLAEASVSEMFGRQNKLQNDLDKFIAKRDAILNKPVKSIAEGMLLQYFNQQIDILQNKIGIEIPNTIKETLGVTFSDLESAIKNAFSAENTGDFLTKFNQSFNDIIRNALINNFVSQQVLGPLSDAMAAAFNPESAGGANVTKAEFAALKELWDKVGAEGSGLFKVFEKLGLSADGAADAIDKTTSSFRNVPAGFKYQVNQFAVATPAGGNAAAGVTTTKSVTVQVDMTNANIYGISDLSRYVQTAVDAALGKGLATT